MKKSITLFICLFIAILASAQSYRVNLNATITEKFKNYEKGDKVKVTAVGSYMSTNKSSNDTYDNEYYKLEKEYFIVVNNDTIPYNNKIADRFYFEYNNMQDLWDIYTITYVLDELQRKGIQEALRNEMEEEALSYINKQKEFGMVFNDPYLEYYIYGLIAKIAPNILKDGRPGNVNVLILENPSMNVGMYSNGTLVINTGLLSALHTEDELVAVLAHEIAHFVLDHNVQNVNAAIARKKRAEFWAGLATGLTAVAEGVATAKSSYYIPGGATLGMAVLSSAVAQQVVDRLGMKYNIEQEEEADEIAIQALEILGYNKNALASALNRMRSIMEQERSHVMYFQSYTHPALVKRIQDAGRPQDISSSDFEREISFAVTSTARMKFEDRRFRQVLPLVEQNINNGVATAEDYILKAHCLLSLHNDSQSNTEVLDMVNMAKSLDESNINIYKAEILANLRLEKHIVAQELLSKYIQRLNEMELSLKEIESDRAWDNTHNFISIERNWAKRMIVKVRAMQ